MFDQNYALEVPPRVRAAMERLRDPQAVWAIFTDDKTIAEMERLTALKRPAVGAASAQLLALGNWVCERDPKTTFGKVARCVMEKRGYVLAAKGVATPQDPLFTKGARYRRRGPDSREAEPGVLTIRGVPEDLIDRLRGRAVRHRRSIEAEALQILAEALTPKGPDGRPNLAEAIHRRFAAIGGIDHLPPHPPVSTEPPPEITR